MFWSGNLKQRDCLEDQGVNGSGVLKWILKEIGWEGLDFIICSERASGGLFNTFPQTEFLDYLRNY